MTRLLAVVCALLLVGGVAGLVTVDDDAGSGVDVAAVLAAVDKTFDGTARFTMEITVDTKQMPMGAGAAKAEGVMDFATERGVVTMTGLTGPLEARITNETAYFRVAETWYSLDAARVPRQEGNPLAALFGPSIGNADPSAAFDLLRHRGVVERVSERGPQTVRGSPTTVYRLTIDTGMFNQQSAAEAADVFDVRNAVMDLAIDGDGRVRQNAFWLTVSAGTFSATPTVTTEYFDFGVPVVVEEPPAAGIVPLRSFEEFEQLLRAGS